MLNSKSLDIQVNKSFPVWLWIVKPIKICWIRTDFLQIIKSNHKINAGLLGPYFYSMSNFSLTEILYFMLEIDGWNFLSTLCSIFKFKTIMAVGLLLSIFYNYNWSDCNISVQCSLFRMMVCHYWWDCYQTYPNVVYLILPCLCSLSIILNPMILLKRKKWDL